MKKAIFIINSLQSGGAERVVVTQANYLQKNGVDVTIICFRKGKKYNVHPGIRLVILSDADRFSGASYLLKIPGLVRKLDHEISRVMGGGDVVLLTSNLLFPDIVVRLSKYSKKAVYVLHAHQDIVAGSRSFLYKWFIRWLYGKRQVVGVSSFVASEMTQMYHLDPAHVRTILNPIDLEEIDKVKDQELEFQTPFILFCGRLTDVKHPERLLEAFREGKFYEKYALVFLGEGELGHKLKSLAKSYGISERVHFAGWETNVYKWMSNASLLVLTSDTEGLAMAVVEALYCGCPVVSVKSKGPEQIMTGELKEYLSAPAVTSLVEKMNAALNFYPEIRPEHMEKYSVNRNVEKYLDVYREWNDHIV